MAKKKRKRKHRRQQETPRQASRQQTNWMTWQLELLNKIQPKVAETVERRNNNGIGLERKKRNAAAGKEV